MLELNPTFKRSIGINEMINCIAIDNNSETLDHISKLCSEIQFITLQKTFLNPIEATRYIRKHPIDLIFVNTTIEGGSGFDFYRALNKNILVVFISGQKEFAFEAYTVNAVDYLLLPFDARRFNQCVTKVHEFYKIRNQHVNNEEHFLHVRSEYSLVKISLVEILFIETLDDYIKIHLIGKKPILTLMSMKTVMDKIPHSEFIRVHRSYIVPISKIESVRGKIISLGITEIPIGKSHEEAFFKAYITKGF